MISLYCLLCREAKRHFEKLWEVKFIGEGIIDQVRMHSLFFFTKSLSFCLYVLFCAHSSVLIEARQRKVCLITLNWNRRSKELGVVKGQ